MTTVPMPPPEMTVGRQGHYAGAVSRLVAFAADVGASWGLYLLGTALLNVAVKLITGHNFTLTNNRVAAFIVLAVWEFLYYSYQWAVSGKTLGMAIFGIQVVTVQGGPISPRQAVLRTVGLALTLLTLGIGFLGVVYQRERRALDDFIAGTSVVYDWDAKAARLRWLARTESAHHGISRQRSLIPAEERTAAPAPAPSGSAAAPPHVPDREHPEP
jgi:uncharacterized RDD family membrane protein YckC